MRTALASFLFLLLAGATTFAQDESTCVVYGMPRVAWEIGAAQRQVKLEHAADLIVRHYEPLASAASPQLASTP